MSKSVGAFKAIEYALGGSVAASLGVLLIGVCLFGLQLARWAEWEGRLVGIVGTVAGVAGAVIGLRMALRADWRANK
jgi:hypothetical protein